MDNMTAISKEVIKVHSEDVTDMDNAALAYIRKKSRPNSVGFQPVFLECPKENAWKDDPRLLMRLARR